ncbi:MarR family transcriptional regulator [Halostagnicola sp. A56]|uniref:ArsR/SmtB family transcription factor n=1 Tax=Halostagnicola sp. A56 TaxID=1495067 RepID=UPI0004A13C6C|nr:metalloregulator ArsR/SmtB family transcription factor [Halostagnicola sp. A56]KDE58240.1 MarR family transcriptional regulator [Halostagnicola sp. A56]
MDSAALLDLLGNENRRRILRLLARKPCYVTEISEYLGVSPKAVIEHLRKLDEAGLVESRVDDQRRKYFHIARNVRLEVNVSPYGFASKSAYPANNSVDITACRHLSVDVASEAGDDVAEADEVAAETGDVSSEAGGAPTESDDATTESGDELEELLGTLERLETLENELSLAQRWVQGKLCETLDQVSEVVGTGPENRIYADLLASVRGDPKSVTELAADIDTHPEIVADLLENMADEGVVRRTERGWELSTDS